MSIRPVPDARGTLASDSTLDEILEYFRDHVEDGLTCPVCRQYARVYTRKLNRGMAQALVQMYRAAGTDWQDKTTTLRGYGSAARDESLLRFWGLLEESPDRREDGTRTGWWRVTELGKRFVLGFITVSSHVRIYANQPLGFTGYRATIEDCLGQPFDRSELMSGSGSE